jgi:putative effector of murein hydrolase
MMKREAEIIGFFFLVVVSFWIANWAFDWVNKPSTIGFVVGWMVILLLIMLWASIAYKVYQRVLLPYLNKVEPKKNEETKPDENKPASVH